MNKSAKKTCATDGWEREQTLHFIKLLRKCEPLYNTNDFNYSTKPEREKRLQYILTNMQKMRPGLTINGVKKKIKTLQSQVSRERSKIRDSYKNGARGVDIYKPTLWCYEDIQFLNQRRDKETNNYESEHDEENKRKNWSDEDLRCLLKLIIEKIHGDSDLFEKPSVQKFYGEIIQDKRTPKHIASLGFYTIQHKMRDMRKCFENVENWQRTVGYVLTEEGNERIVDEHMAIACPQYDLLEQIFGNNGSECISNASDTAGENELGSFCEVSCDRTDLNNYVFEGNDCGSEENDNATELSMNSVELSLPNGNAVEEVIKIEDTLSPPPQKKVKLNIHSEMEGVNLKLRERIESLKVEKLKIQLEMEKEKIQLQREQLEFEKEKFKVDNELQRYKIHKEMELRKLEMELKYKSNRI